MNNHSFIVNPQAIYLSFVFLFNSLLLFSYHFYIYIYPFYVYIATALLIVGFFLTSSFKFNKSVLIFTVVLLVAAVIDTKFNQLPLGELFPIFWFVGLYYCFGQLSSKHVEKSLIPLICFCIWLYLVLFSFAHYRVFKEYISSSESHLPIVNPNAIGIGIAEMCLLIFAFFKDWKDKKKISAGLILITLFAIYLTFSRTALLFFVVVMLGYLFLGNLISKNRKIAVILLTVIIVFGFVFPLIYIQLWKHYGYDLKLLGKSFFTGREWIWSNLLDYMKEHPNTYWYGAGKIERLFWFESYNLHNTYFAYWTQYGLIASLLFWIWLISVVRGAYSKDKGILSNRQVAMYFFILFTALVGFTETNYNYVLTTIYPAFAFGTIKYRE